MTGRDMTIASRDYYGSRKFMNNLEIAGSPRAASYSHAAAEHGARSDFQIQQSFPHTISAARLHYPRIHRS